MSPSDPRRRVQPVIWSLVALCVLLELVLSGADHGLWGNPDWRLIAIEYGGFWSGLLGDWKPNFAGQAVLMFLSYGFLHAGFWHLVMNMVTLISLGPPLVRGMGTLRFVLLYFAAEIGGGFAFAALYRAPSPMIGASGALFGLAGAWLALEYGARMRRGMTIWPVLRVCLWLVGLNFVMWWALSGMLAWQTHLGGFLAGWLFVIVAPNRHRKKR